MTTKIALIFAFPVTVFLVGLAILYTDLVVWAGSAEREPYELWGPWDVFEMALLLWGIEMSFSTAGYGTILYINRTDLNTMSLQDIMRVIGYVFATTLLAVIGITLISPACGAMIAPLIVILATVLAIKRVGGLRENRHKTPNTG